MPPYPPGKEECSSLLSCTYFLISLYALLMCKLLLGLGGSNTQSVWKYKYRDIGSKRVKYWCTKIHANLVYYDACQKYVFRNRSVYLEWLMFFKVLILQKLNYNNTLKNAFRSSFLQSIWSANHCNLQRPSSEGRGAKNGFTKEKSSSTLTLSKWNAVLVILVQITFSS